MRYHHQYHTKIILLDVATMGLLSVFVCNDFGGILLPLWLLVLNAFTLVMLLLSLRKELRVFHLLGKPRIIELFEYYLLHGLTLLASLVCLYFLFCFVWHQGMASFWTILSFALVSLLLNVLLVAILLRRIV